MHIVLFKVNDLELTEHIIRIREAHSLTSGAVRIGELHRALTELSKIEDHARRAQWRILDLIKAHKDAQK